MRETLQIQIDTWNSATDGDRAQIVRTILESVSREFSFKVFRQSSIGSERHSVAVFQFRDSEFALIPGAEVTLGHDPSNAFGPTAAQLKSWQGSVRRISKWREAGDQGPFDPSLNNYLAKVSSPLRTVVIPPFLMEIDAHEVGVDAIPLETPEVVRFARDVEDRPSTAHNSKLRVRFDESGPIEAFRIQWQNQADALCNVQRQGFRLPTSDEFEYACRGFTRSLFRWGNDTPTNEEPDHCEWTLHRQPSDLGINIAQTPYAHEFVMEPEIMCGGDGGVAICSGAGVFMSWLTLSSSFRSSGWGSHPKPLAHCRRVWGLEC